MTYLDDEQLINNVAEYWEEFYSNIENSILSEYE